MSSLRHDDDDDPAWPPRTAVELPFGHPHAQAMLPLRRDVPPVTMVSLKSNIGADADALELGGGGRKPKSEMEYTHATVRMLGRLGIVIAVIVVAVTVLVGLQSVVLWRLSVRAEDSMTIASQYVTSSSIAAAVDETLGSIHNVHSATASAAHAGQTVDAGISTAVTALNETSVLLREANLLLGNLVRNPAISLSLGNGGTTTGH